MFIQSVDEIAFPFLYIVNARFFLIIQIPIYSS